MYSLREVPVFHSLSDTQLEAVERYCAWRKYAEDEVILSAGHNDRSDVFFVVEGQVRMAVHSGFAREITFVDLGPGDMFGELAALDAQARAITVVALSGCLVGSLPHERFRDCLFEHRYAAQYLLRHLATGIRLLSAPVETEANRSDARRILAELLRRCAPDPELAGNWVVSPVPHVGDLARACGASDAAEVAAITHLACEGLIREQGSALRILDRARLQYLVSC